MRCIPKVYEIYTRILFITYRFKTHCIISKRAHHIASIKLYVPLHIFYQYAILWARIFLSPLLFTYTNTYRCTIRGFLLTPSRFHSFRGWENSKSAFFLRNLHNRVHTQALRAHIHINLICASGTVWHSYYTLAPHNTISI